MPAVLRPRKNDITDANFPVDAEGRTYHLGTRRGEVANRILSVGSEKRALMLAEYLQPVAPGRGLFMLESSRGFLTITGGWVLGACRFACVQRRVPITGFMHHAAAAAALLLLLCTRESPVPWDLCWLPVG